MRWIGLALLEASVLAHARSHTCVQNAGSIGTFLIYPSPFPHGRPRFSSEVHRVTRVFQRYRSIVVPYLNPPLSHLLTSLHFQRSTTRTEWCIEVVKFCEILDLKPSPGRPNQPRLVPCSRDCFYCLRGSSSPVGRRMYEHRKTTELKRRITGGRIRQSADPLDR